MPSVTSISATSPQLTGFLSIFKSAVVDRHARSCEMIPRPPGFDLGSCGKCEISANLDIQAVDRHCSGSLMRPGTG